MLLFFPTRILIQRRYLAQFVQVQRQEYHLRTEATLADGGILYDSRRIEAIPLTFGDITSCQRLVFQVFHNAPTAHVIEASAFVKELDQAFALDNLVEIFRRSQVLIRHAWQTGTITHGIKRPLDGFLIASVGLTIDFVRRSA